MDAESLPDAIETVPEAIAWWAERTPLAPALIVAEDSVVTYADLWHRVATVATALGSAGIGRNDRVVLLVPDGSQLAVALLGTMAAAIAAPLPADLTITELDASLRGLRANAAIVSPAIDVVRRECLTRHELRILEFDDAGVLHEDLQRGAASTPRFAPTSADIALVHLTSGTSGLAKRVPDTHAEILANARERRRQFGFTPLDRALAVAPLTLSLGTCVLFHTIVAGGALIFPPAADLDTLLATLDEHRPTWMFPSAGLLEVLAVFLRDRPPLPRPSSLRLVRVTAAPISAALCAELEERLGVPVLNSYSSTEAGLIATAKLPPARHKPGSVGEPIVDLQIVGEDERVVGVGGTGEIWVRGEKFAAGYLDDPERNADVFRPGGWFRTGDVGYLDEDGFLYLTGRLSQLINRGGLKIAPAEIDAVLIAHPAVCEAAAFAVPDARLGEDVAAAVVLRAGQQPTARELRAWLLARLSAQKAPRRIWFVDALPRTALGKVRRDELRRRWLARTTPR